jgi:EpsI family protein
VRPAFAGAAWLVLIGALVAGFWRNFYEMWLRWFPGWNRYDSLYDRIMEGESYYTHGPLVPLVSLIIAVLLVRHTRIRVRPRPIAGGIALTGVLLIHLLSTLARVNFVSCFAMVGVVASLVLLAWGWGALRRLWFPIAFLVFMVPLPEVLIADVNFRLKMIATSAGVSLASVLGVLVESSGNRVFLTGDKSLVVANVCNGLRTIISLLAFGALYAYVCKLKHAWRIGLFVLSLPVALISNAIRICALIVVADVWDEATATGAFHDYSGLAIYVIAFSLMFGAEKLIIAGRAWAGRPVKIDPLFHDVRRDESVEDHQGERLAGALRGWGIVAACLPVAALAGWAIWLNLAEPVVFNAGAMEHAVPAQLVIGGKPYASRPVEVSKKALAVLETQDYFFRRYVAAGVQPLDLTIIYSRDNRKGTHPPDLCLEGAGQEVIHKRSFVLDDMEATGPIRCTELVVQRGGESSYFLYFYKCGEHYTNSFWEQQLVIFANGLFSRDASGALIRASTDLEEDVATARRRCSELLRAAMPHLHQALSTPRP